MIARNIILPAFFIVTYLGVVDATKGMSTKRRNDIDTITPLTEKENAFLGMLFNRGIFKLSEPADDNVDNTEEPLPMRRRLSSKKSKKASSDSDSSRRHAHKLEHTT